MEEEKGAEHEALRAMQIVAVSGFVKHIDELQRSCLCLWNACRDGVPVHLLKLFEYAPFGLRRLFYSGMVQPDASLESRVLPHRQVLKVLIEVSSRIFMTELGKRQENGVMFDITKVTWPQGTRDIQLSHVSGDIQGIVWPENLERLTFGNKPDIWGHASFNISLDGVHFPSGLREILLGDSFNHPIDNVSWPEGLEKLSMPGFNHPIDKVRWPAGLKVLEFLHPNWVAERREGIFEYLDEVFSPFDQPIDTGLPARLHTLWLSDDFNQTIDTVVWPVGLVTIGFGSKFRQSLKGVVWPVTLCELLLW